MTPAMDTISLLAGLAIGILLASLITLLICKSRMVRRTDYERVRQQQQEGQAALQLSEDRYTRLQEQQQQLMEKCSLQETTLIQLQTKAAGLQVSLSNAGTRISEMGILLDKETLSRQQQEQVLQTRQEAIARLEASQHSHQERLRLQQETISRQEEQLADYTAQLQRLQQQNSHWQARQEALQEQMKGQEQRVQQLQREAQLQFERMANQILEEKTARFTETNKDAIAALLNPLKEDLGKFKSRVEETYDKESKQRFALEERVKELITQTNKVSNEANNLAKALKGQTKTQGDWGEMILERILESSGLSRNREYFVQQTIKDASGRNLRPDILVHLPEDRVVIIDAKVSLTAYDRFAAEEQSELQQVYLKEHLKSIYAHIQELQSKNYDQLASSLDFTMMFVPVEPAYMLAIQADPDLWAYAYARRILLISPTNLIACLKLISDLWNREKQSRHALEIVRRGERLYEKFVGFTANLEDIGRHLDKLQVSYNTALGQLKNGRGNLVSQAMQLQALGLKSGRKIPDSLLPDDAVLGSEDEELPGSSYPDKTGGENPG